MLQTTRNRLIAPGLAAPTRLEALLFEPWRDLAAPVDRLASAALPAAGLPGAAAPDAQLAWVPAVDVEEHEDGLTVRPAPLAASRPWRAFADHRMATTGALLGLAVPGLVVDDIGTTAKTLPDFVDLWSAMLRGGAR